MKNATPNLDWNMRVCFRGLLASLFIACAFLFQSCRSPIIEVNRNAHLIESHITANGNTVTPGGF